MNDQEPFKAAENLISGALKTITEQPKRIGRPGRLIPAAQKILAEYNNRVTIRQLYYRLVSAGIIRNSLVSYNVLVQRMIVARRNGEIDYEAFYDATRHIVEGEEIDPDLMDPEEMFNENKDVVENAEQVAIDQLKDTVNKFDLPFWYNQPNYIEVWIEKEALASVVQPIAEKYGVSFVACKGYPSLSLLYDASKRLETVSEEKEIRILYFGDYDCRGLNIEESLSQNLEDDFGIDAEVIRYALTKEQIQQYALPPQPAKKTDTMIKGWIEIHGDVAWELDALPPDVLIATVENAIRQNIDNDKAAERETTIDEKKAWLTNAINTFLEQWNNEQ
jgi:hypothetical protein